MIEIQHISKRYPQAKAKALDDVSLIIESGEFYQKQQTSGKINQRVGAVRNECDISERTGS